MKSLRIARLGLFAAVFTLVACEGAGGEFRDGFPTADNVRLEVPGRSGSALESPTGTQRSELQGETADFYKLTRGVTVSVNAGVGAVLNLVRNISEHPPTTVNGNTAVWGPHTEDLSPNTWRFTVTKVSANTWDYVLEGKAKTANDSDYVAVLSGSHTPGLDANGQAMKHFGQGEFVLDFDAAKTLPEHGREEGRAEVRYARLDAASETTIDVDFKNIREEETGALTDASYRYRKLAQQGGAFEFSLNKDIHAGSEPQKSAVEHLSIKSRWNPDGSGRSDVKATGGDLPATATANECWDSNFLSQYLHANWAPLHGWGAEAQCSFTTADYSSL